MKIKYIILISIFIVGIEACYKPSDYDLVSNNSSLLKIMPLHTNIPANGLSFDTIAVLVPVNSDQTKRMVFLKTNAGIFLDTNAQTIRINNFHLDNHFPGYLVSYAFLQSMLHPTVAKLRGFIQNNETDTTVNFTVDTATKITVQGNKFFIHSGFDELDITATLSIPKIAGGFPSTGQFVKFIASQDSLGKSQIGYFRSVVDTTDINGNATAVFSGDTTYRGKLFITAWAIRGRKDTIKAIFKFFEIK